jgi:localization factor PodJL
MRPGVPWNVKGIEADAREAAQVAARRAGVSLGEYLTQLIMSEGRVIPLQQAGQQQPLTQAYQQNSGMTADGTWGPMTQYPPQPTAFRQPTAYQQPQPQTYPQAVPQPQIQPQMSAQTQRDALSGAAQILDSQIRGSEFTVVAHGLRELADRLESSERRAQQAISTVNQTVSQLGDRIDAAERVKQLADVAFTSAADALAQAARDQAGAFDALEATVRNLSNRIGEVERSSQGASGAGKETYQRLEQSFEQLKTQFRDAERKSGDAMAAFDQWQRQLSQRIDQTEHTVGRMVTPESMARLENVITTLKADFIESHGRAREEFGTLTNFLREVGSRLEKAERVIASNTFGPRIDALDARHNALMDETRQALASMDTRIAQAAANGAPLQDIKVLKSSVDELSQTVAALSARVDAFSDAKRGPMSGTIGAVQTTLEAITQKIEDGERRQAESVQTVSSALKSITNRLEEADKRQAQASQTFNRRLDESDRRFAEADRRAADSAGAIEDAMKALTQRVETSDRKHKEAIASLRLTVDGLVAKAAADALPHHSPLAQATIASSPLSSAPPFASTIQSSTLSAPPPPSFNVPPPASVAPPPMSSAPPPFEAAPPPPTKADEGMTVSALQTILSGTLSSHSDEPPAFTHEAFEPEKFAPEAVDTVGLDEQPAPPKNDFLSQARRAAQAAAQAEADRSGKRQTFATPSGERLPLKKLNIGRLAIISIAAIVLVGGILALVMTWPNSSSDDTNRPAPGSSIGEMLNGGATPSAGEQPAAPPAGGTAQPQSNLTPTPDGAAPEAAASTPAAPAAPEFTSGASPLPGGSPLTPEAGPVGGADIGSLEAAANAGDAKAQFVLALRYAEGRGVEKDEAKAAALVSKAANAGLVVAQYRMGALNERGIGIPKNLAEAKKWYERAALGGNRKAMHNLGVMNADGTGIGQNYPEAAKWFKQGAEFGVTDSQYNLAVLYERGMGVDKNQTEAAKWFAIAAAQGDTDAAAKLEQLKKTMNPAELQNALAGAKAFQAKPVDPVANEVPSFPG